MRVSDPVRVISVSAGEVISVVLSFEAATVGGRVVHSVAWETRTGLILLVTTQRKADAIALVYVERSGIHRMLCRMRFADGAYQERRVMIIADEVR